MALLADSMREWSRSKAMITSGMESRMRLSFLSALVLWVMSVRVHSRVGSPSMKTRWACMTTNDSVPSMSRRVNSMLPTLQAEASEGTVSRYLATRRWCLGMTKSKKDRPGRPACPVLQRPAKQVLA